MGLLALLLLIVAAFAGLMIVLIGHARESHTSSNGRISLVAAEDQYGSIAQAIGGNRVQVTSLLKTPNTDPHEFEAGSSTARTVAGARLVIKNGIGYDTWIDKLLSASPRSGRIVIDVGEYLGLRTGDNPHVWYSPAGWPRVAAKIAADLSTLDPGHRAYFQRRKAAWLRSLEPVYREIAIVRGLTQGKKVIATEPVYGYMIAALGAPSLDYDFQKAIMDGTDPSPQSVAAFQNALRSRDAHMLFYNKQVVGPTTGTMRSIAASSGVATTGVTETQPPALSFVQWQLSQLRTIQRHWK